MLSTSERSGSEKVAGASLSVALYNGATRTRLPIPLLDSTISLLVIELFVTSEAVLLRPCKTWILSSLCPRDKELSACTSQAVQVMDLEQLVI